jgi:hypothetical protein
MLYPTSFLSAQLQVCQLATNRDGTDRHQARETTLETAAALAAIEPLSFQSADEEGVKSLDDILR